MRPFSNTLAGAPCAIEKVARFLSLSFFLSADVAI